jgi:hypothetical protein
MRNNNWIPNWNNGQSYSIEINSRNKSLEAISISGSYNSVNDSIVFNAVIQNNLWRKYTITNASDQLGNKGQCFSIQLNG